MLVQLFQPGELRREAAFAGGVDDQHDLAFEGIQRDVFAGDVFGLEAVNRFFCAHGVSPG
jgi:hypothetical protein